MKKIMKEWHNSWIFSFILTIYMYLFYIHWKERKKINNIYKINQV